MRLRKHCKPFINIPNWKRIPFIDTHIIVNIYFFQFMQLNKYLFIGSHVNYYDILPLLIIWEVMSTIEPHSAHWRRLPETACVDLSSAYGTVNQRIPIQTFYTMTKDSSLGSVMQNLLAEHKHTPHIFNCNIINTNLTVMDLWINPMDVEKLLAVWG